MHSLLGRLSWSGLARNALAALAMTCAMGAATRGDNAERGAIELDGTALQKLTGKQFHMLVSVQEFAWKGIEHFGEVAEALADLPDVLVAKVDLSRAGSEVLQQSASVLPVLFWYRANSTVPTAIPGPHEAGKVILFAQLQLSPELQSLHAKAAQFSVSVSATKRAELLEEAKAVAAQLPAAFSTSGNAYLALMQRVDSSGTEFLTKESERLGSLIDRGGLAKDKRAQFRQRLATVQAIASDIGF